MTHGSGNARFPSLDLSFVARPPESSRATKKHLQNTSKIQEPSILQTICHVYQLQWCYWHIMLCRMSGFFLLGAPNLDEMGRCSKDIHVYKYCSFGIGHDWKPGIHSRQHRDYPQLLVGKHPFGNYSLSIWIIFLIPPGVLFVASKHVWNHATRLTMLTTSSIVNLLSKNNSFVGIYRSQHRGHCITPTQKHPHES